MSLVETVEQIAEAGAPDRDVERELHPGIGKPSGPPLSCSNRFSTARNEALPAALSRSRVVRTTASAP